MLANILRNFYIDPEWVAGEYLRRCKVKAWKKENTMKSLKCFNLERITKAKVFGLKSPEEVVINEYLDGLADA